MSNDIPGGDVEACVGVMQEDGHDEDTARRMCEVMHEEASAENGNVDELREAFGRAKGLIADVGVELNSAVDKPAIDSEWVAFKSEGDAGPDDANTQIDAPLVFRKSDDAETREEKRIAYAPAMIPREIDKEGDVVATPTVERAAHDYVKSGGGVDSDHDLIDGKGEVVESWILPEAKSWDTPDGDSKEYPAGTWMVGIEWDAKTWERIQAGELEGLSIYGKAEHVELAKADETAKGFEVPFAADGVVHVVYESESLAERAADEMGLDGETHEHELDGSTVHMPGESHEAFVDAYMDTVEATAKDDSDPCWDGYTMVGTDGNGDPRCVPDDDVPDAEGFENAVSMDGSGPPDDVRDGVTPKNAGGEANKQDSPMSDTTDDRVDEIAASVSELTETVDELKDAVDTDKEPGDGENVLRDLAAELANREEVGQSTADIISDLQSTYLSDKESDDDEEEEHEEDYDDEEKADTDTDTDTEKSVDESDPNFSKADDGGDTAAVAKDAQAGANTVPSYAATLEDN